MIAALDEYNHSADETLETVIHLVQGFGGSDQADDLTLIVARVAECQNLQSSMSRVS